MPYKSLKQERYFNANRGKLEAQGVNVDEWNSASKGMKLPTKAKEATVAKAKGSAGAPYSNQDAGGKKFNKTAKAKDAPLEHLHEKDGSSILSSSMYKSEAHSYDHRRPKKQVQSRYTGSAGAAY